MSDMIDRQAALDALHKWELSYTWDEYCIESPDEVYSPSSAIKALPSAQRWILVSEKFPEWHWTEYNGERCWESEPVLVYFGKTKWPYHSMAVGEYGDGRWEIEDNCFPDWGDPIAWMPLPKEPEINENNQTEATE